jgi:hypothetical protein
MSGVLRALVRVLSPGKGRTPVQQTPSLGVSPASVLSYNADGTANVQLFGAPTPVNVVPLGVPLSEGKTGLVVVNGSQLWLLGADAYTPVCFYEGPMLSAQTGLTLPHVPEPGRGPTLAEMRMHEDSRSRLA